MKTLTYIVFLCCACMTFQGVAQKKKNRLQPGRMYAAGETLYAPRFGFTAKVPEGWEGMLPRDSEVFLLTTTTSTYGEIYVFGREQGTLETMLEGWKKGVELSETIKLVALKPILQDGVLSSEVTGAGEYINKGVRGFAISRCNPKGPCITTFVVAPLQFYDSVKNDAIQFMKSGSFESPSTASPYTDFDWQEFLSNKVVATFAAVQGGSKETMIHLCADGTFQASIKKSGILKNQNEEYRGRQTGKWNVTGTGETATIQFTFDKKKLPMLEAPLVIREEKVFSNEERYFVGQSDKCK
jgi:hypothetical protein